MNRVMDGCHQRKGPGLRDLFEVGGTGLEPVTPACRFGAAVRISSLRCAQSARLSGIRLASERLSERERTSSVAIVATRLPTSGGWCEHDLRNPSLPDLCPEVIVIALALRASRLLAVAAHRLHVPRRRSGRARPERFDNERGRRGRPPPAAAPACRLSRMSPSGRRSTSASAAQQPAPDRSPTMRTSRMRCNKHGQNEPRSTKSTVARPRGHCLGTYKRGSRSRRQTPATQPRATAPTNSGGTQGRRLSRARARTHARSGRSRLRAKRGGNRASRR
jgi:hypothetical protein